MTNNSDVSRNIQSVWRALSILDLFNEHTQELTLSEITNALGLNKSTVYGLVNTLYQKHYLGKNYVNGKYVLGQSVVDKFTFIQKQVNVQLLRVGLSQLRYLVNKYAVTGMIFSYQNYTLTNLKTLSPFVYDFTPIMDFHCAVSGRLVLANWKKEEVEAYFRHTPMTKYTDQTITDLGDLFDLLEFIKAQGVSMEFDEIIVGFSAIAVPLYDEQKKMLGTISITGQTEKIKSRKEEICADLKRAAQEISESI